MSKNCPYKEIELEQGSPEWRRWRLEGFGASDAPVLMGGNPWKSIEELIDEKRGLCKEPANENMRRGTRLEPEARDKYCKKVGFKVNPICLQHKKYSWARASLDGISEDRKKVVEIKCGESAYNCAVGGDVPTYYYGQLQHILFITGLKIIDFWCYLPGRQGILLKIDRDDPYIEELIEKGEEYKSELSGQP